MRRNSLLKSASLATVLIFGGANLAHAGCFDEILSLLGITPASRFDLNTADSNMQMPRIDNLRGKPRHIEVNGFCEHLSFGFDTELESSELLLFWSRKDKPSFEDFMKTVMGQKIQFTYFGNYILITNIDPQSYLPVLYIANFPNNSVIIGNATSTMFDLLFHLAPLDGAEMGDKTLMGIPEVFSSSVSSLINQHYYDSQNVVGITFDTGSGIPELIYNPKKADGPFEIDPGEFWAHRGRIYQDFEKSEFVLNTGIDFYPHDHVAFPKDMKASTAIGFAQIAEAISVIDRVYTITSQLNNGGSVVNIGNLNKHFTTSTQFGTPTTVPTRGLVKLELNRTTSGFAGQHDLEIRIHSDGAKARVLGVIATIVQNNTMLNNVSPIQYVDPPNERIDVKAGNIQGMIRFYIASAQIGNYQDLVAALQKIKAGIDTYYQGLNMTTNALVWSRSIYDSNAGLTLMTSLNTLVKNNNLFFAAVGTYLQGGK